MHPTVGHGAMHREKGTPWGQEVCPRWNMQYQTLGSKEMEEQEGAGIRTGIHGDGERCCSTSWHEDIILTAVVSLKLSTQGCLPRSDLPVCKITLASEQWTGKEQDQMKLMGGGSHQGTVAWSRSSKGTNCKQSWELPREYVYPDGTYKVREEESRIKMSRNVGQATE